MIDIENIMEMGISDSATLPDGNMSDQYGNIKPAFTPDNFAALCNIVNELAGYISSLEKNIYKELGKDYDD